GFGRGELTDEWEQQSGFGGDAGAGGENNAVEIRHFVEGDLIVLVNSHGCMQDCFYEVNEVVGEGVVVVEDEDFLGEHEWVKLRLFRGSVAIGIRLAPAVCATVEMAPAALFFHTDKNGFYGCPRIFGRLRREIYRGDREDAETIN